MKITKITDESIEFNDGTIITYDHDQDCCETNYADFPQLQDTGIEQEEFTAPLQFEKCDDGFRFGNAGKMYFVPCYSYQNGYYSCEVDILVNGKVVLETEGELNCVD